MTQIISMCVVEFMIILCLRFANYLAFAKLIKLFNILIRMTVIKSNKMRMF